MSILGKSTPFLAALAMGIGAVGMQAGHASAGAIYADNFGTAYSGTSDLNGSMPTLDTASAKWTAPAGTFTTGNGAATVSAAGTGNGYTAYLPLTLAANTTYTLTTTLKPTAGTTGDWLSMGFGTQSTAAANSGGANEQAWLTYADNGGSETYYGGGKGNGAAGGTATAAGTADKFTITLNTGTGGVFYADSLGLVTGHGGTLTSANLAGINAVFIGNYQSATGTFSSLIVNSTPDSTPEPATLSIAAAGGGIGLLLRRKRKTV